MSLEKLIGQLLLLVLPKSYCLSEVISVSQLAWPITFTYLMEQLIPIVIMVFCGHIGEHELAVASFSGLFHPLCVLFLALGVAYCNIVVLLPIYGLSLALDNLGSQAFGSGNLKRLGLVVQRSIVIHFILLIPALIVCWQCEPILLYLDQDPDLTRSVEGFIWIYCTGFPGFVLHSSLQQYMILQHVVKPTILISLLSNLVTITACYVLIFRFDMGLSGAAWAAVIAYYSETVLSIVCILYLRLPDKTWPSLSMNIFHQWGQYLKFALPSMLGVCIECWYFEIATVTIGTLGNTQLAVMSIVKQTSEIIYMVPMGISAAATIRVGNSLGAGQPITSQKMSVVAVGYAVLTSSVVGVLLYLTKNFIGKLFINDDDVVSLVSAVVPLLIISQLLDSVLGVHMAVLTGCGLQKIATPSTFVGYYLLSLPIGVLLAVRKELGVYGLWIGIVIGLIVQNCFLVYVIRNLNWSQLSIKAQKEADIDNVKLTDDLNLENLSSIQHSANGDVIPDATLIAKPVAPLAHSLARTISNM